MVAITVILAAVIGTFVLGLGDQVGNNAPQASFTFDYESGTSSGSDCWGTAYSSTDHPLKVTHDSGTSIEASHLSLKGGVADQTLGDGSCMGATSKVNAGTTVEYAAQDGDSVQLVWTADDGDSSSTIQKWSGPSA